MKLTDAILSAIIKKGILYEARNVDTDINIPTIVNDKETIIRINFKAEHMTLRIEKEEA